ncbi:MAG: hypothetical protein OXG89_08085 [bacterium]|nr:hypothetical protein [bacterium]MCY3652965.1 hypothetical protein [bacterium]
MPDQISRLLTPNITVLADVSDVGMDHIVIAGKSIKIIIAKTLIYLFLDTFCRAVGKEGDYVLAPGGRSSLGYVSGFDSQFRCHHHLMTRQWPVTPFSGETCRFNQHSGALYPNGGFISGVGRQFAHTVNHNACPK